MSPDWRWALGVTWAMTGERDRARQIVAELEAENRSANSFNLAHVHAALDDRDAVFRCLEEAYRFRDSFMPWIREVPLFRGLRDDPRFDSLLRRMLPTVAV